jgi:hypothetical protein
MLKSIKGYRLKHSKMILQKFQILILGISVLGCLLAPVASAQNLAQPIKEDSTQPQTCLRDPQGLMCNVDSSADRQAAQFTATASQPIALSSQQLEGVSNVLIGLLYLALPAGLGLALFLHDRQEDHFSQQLKMCVELLERIWRQDLQA